MAAQGKGCQEAAWPAHKFWCWIRKKDLVAGIRSNNRSKSFSSVQQGEIDPERRGPALRGDRAAQSCSRPPPYPNNVTLISPPYHMFMEIREVGSPLTLPIFAPPSPTALETPSLQQPSAKAQGKRRATSEDEVSSVHSPLEDAAMLLGKDLPTKVLRIRHLPEAMSTTAFTFAERFSAHLLAAGVQLVSVLGAQHAIWLCVQNAEEGEKARAFFKFLGQKWGPSQLDLTFEREEVFMEAQLYTSDVWSPDLTKESDSAAAVPMDVDELVI
ncbi:hypothetical protein DFH09DRAFT_1316295 [Mycena vulgaris]|nr:hypothetical protein DFH09DRAFT_1316295 [Mycena vulgaris]